MKKFLFSKGPLLAALVVILYGILVFLIYFTGYEAMPNHIDEMPITIVNQDSKSKALANQIEDKLDFKHIKKTTSMKQAKKDLNNRDSFLIINIPKNFAKDIKQNKRVNLNFYVNESTSYSGVSGMKNIATTIGNTVNQQVVIEKGKTMLNQAQLTVLQQKVEKQKQQMASELQQSKQQIAAAPAAQQAQLKQKLQTKTQQSQQAAKSKINSEKQKILKRTNSNYQNVSNSVNVKVHQVNKVKSGLNNALAPFFANLAIYIGSLLGTLLLYGTFVKFSKRVGRLRSFVMLEGTMLILAVLGSAIVSAVIAPMMNLGGTGYGQLFVNHGLEIFAAYNFNAILMLLIGQVGTVLNIFLTMIQVVSGAGMVPLVTMNGFYQFAHFISPMYYSVQADFNIMFGGTGTSQLWWELILLTLGIMIVNTVIVMLRKKPMMVNFEDLS